MLIRQRFIVQTAIFVLLFSTSLFAASAPNNLTRNSQVVSPAEEIVPQSVISYLQSKNPETAKVWIYFTDKGIFDKSDFNQKAASVQLSEKVLKRRAKVHQDHVVFADIPVDQSYVDQIVNLGAKHRRSSRWLNAASFELTYDQLERVKQLPFVQSIKPMVGFHKDYPSPEPVENIKIEPDHKALSPDALNYGSSYVQLEQIHVPEVHAKGYTGQGVTLCMTDTGFRKTHDAFSIAYSQNRVLAEYDFVFNDSETANEPIDWSSQWNHGTLTWATAAGEVDGTLYGPAYGANFLLAKTEDVRSETSVEEDNWVAALEWADSLGADVISCSLGYSDWYTQSDFDGNTCTITLAANTCASLGIVLCNSMGNSGPGATSLTAPADAFDILAVGAVNSSGTIANFSSRGPSADGRTKPEVCAMGVGTLGASTATDDAYTTASGTSLSTPLVAGSACLLIEARPNFPPTVIRQALMETADNAATPNNDYGSGIINVDAALGWGANMTADNQSGNVPFTVNFSGSSPLTVSSWEWSFGDGSSSTEQNPSHTYTESGVYDVSLTVNTEYGPIDNVQSGYIFVFADTMYYSDDSAFAGHEAVMSVNLTNSQPLQDIRIPFRIVDGSALTFDSVSRGSRTSYFEGLTAIAYDPWNYKYTFLLRADNGGGSPPLPKGDGEVLRMYFSINGNDLGGTSYLIDSSTVPYSIQLSSPYTDYSPNFFNGHVSAINVIRGDLNYDFNVDIADLVYMVTYSFADGPPPETIQMFDVNADQSMDIADISYLVDYMFNEGPPPVSP